MTTTPFTSPGDAGPIPAPPIQPPPTRRRGFPQTAVGPDPHAPSTQRPFRQPVRPTGLPHRPRGAWFTTAIGVTIFITLGWVIYSATMRSSLVGQISGRVVRVSPPFDGVIHAVYVREGQRVVQGQLLLSITNVELQHQIDRLHDELYLAQATLQSQVARLRWETDVGADSSRRVLADYYELWGDLSCGKKQDCRNSPINGAARKSCPKRVPSLPNRWPRCNFRSRGSVPRWK